MTTKIRLNTQVQWKLPANSLYNWDETIAWNKLFNDTIKVIITQQNATNLIAWYGNDAWRVELTTDDYQWAINVYSWTPWATPQIKLKANADSYIMNNLWLWTTTPSEKLEVAWNITPSIDNSYTIWKSWKRWSSVWAANGTIQTSDRRTKTDITPTELWLDFIDKLNPVSYKWIEWWNTVTYEEVEVEKEVQEEVEIKYQEESIKLIDWKYVKVIEEKTRVEKVFDEVDLYNENWEVIGKHKVPRMVKKLVKEKKEVITPTAWKRNHFWFIAQEVEEALAWTDFGWLVIDENWQYALRYDQFISPLVAAVKELKARVEYLENNK